MISQAEGLKDWVKNRYERALQPRSREYSEGGRVLVVTSGKGGVGKSSVALNLALALSDQGQRVVILDADMGLANINIMLGMQPKYTLWDVVEGRIHLRQSLEQGPHGIRIIPGGSGISALAQVGPVEISRIIEGFREIEGECDWLMVDTGAGISPNVLSFVLAGDEVLVLTNPEPTALADAYGLIKSVWEEKGQASLKLVVNRAVSEEAAIQMGNRLIGLADRMLGQPVEFYGTIADDGHVGRAIIRQEAFYLAYPRSLASQGIKQLADRLVNRAVLPRRTGMGTFVRQLRDAWLRLSS